MIERGNGRTESRRPGNQTSQSAGDDIVLAEQPVSAQSAQSAQARSLVRFYMTSDLRAATGLTRTHLDFYLRENIIVPTARTESGYLLFDDTELATLRQVITWRQDGVGIRDIRARLDRGSEEQAAALPTLPALPAD